MSLMFAKQFSEAGATSGAGGGKKGGRGGKGGGLMSKSKRRGKDLEDAGDVFNLYYNHRCILLSQNIKRRQE